MLVNQTQMRTLWIPEENEQIIRIIDQRHLPHDLVIEDLTCLEEVLVAIKDMHIRGAGLIGVAAAYGMYLAAIESDEIKNAGDIELAANRLIATRPTAKNISWAVNKQLQAINKGSTKQDKIRIARSIAQDIYDDDMQSCYSIGIHGLKLLKQISVEKRGDVIHILTHCNAGWLAFIDYGTALAPVYEAHKKGIKVHVWVDETRPRNQGASLTAWELQQQGIDYTVIADNTGGHLMQKGMVDIVLTGADRVTSTGDVANKIGTYLKALAAKDNNIPFYVAFPHSTIDWSIDNGITQIPIEQRDEREVKYIQGLYNGGITEILLTPSESRTANYGFDITPSRLISGFITEKGICTANSQGLTELYSDNSRKK